MVATAMALTALDRVQESPWFFRGSSDSPLSFSLQFQSIRGGILLLQQWHLIKNLILYRNFLWTRLENTELSNSHLEDLLILAQNISKSLGGSFLSLSKHMIKQTWMCFLTSNSKTPNLKSLKNPSPEDVM